MVNYVILEEKLKEEEEKSAQLIREKKLGEWRRRIEFGVNMCGHVGEDYAGIENDFHMMMMGRRKFT